MKEALAQYKDKGIQFWRDQSQLVKGSIIAIFIVFILVIFLLVIQSRPDFVPLYSNLSAQETGQIKATLDSEGVPSKISGNGTTISVPKDQADALKVELAAQGIPESGHIDYSFFGENAGWGMTDNEFKMVKQEAMQTELSQLITSINGVKAASVMLSLPKKSVWVSDKEQQASASVVLDLEIGYRLKPAQVQSLYHLVSKSVPHLPINNIVIMDEMFNYFEPVEGNPDHSTFAAYEQQREIKNDIEQDIQQRVQRMLGMMMGRDKVVVSVTTDIDFTKEKSTKQLVEPIDKENMEGLQVSVERIRETYSGDGNSAGGVPGTGGGDVQSFQGTNGQGNGNYNRVEERINNVFNHIQKTIVKSPYTIRDMGIQVMVEPPDPNNPSSLPQGRINDIQSILSTIIRTTLPKDEGRNLSKQEIADKIYVSVQPFNGRVEVETKPKSVVPLWYYAVAGALLLMIILLIFLLLRKRNNREEDIMEDFQEKKPAISDQLEPEEKQETIRRKQLEKMAKEQPEQFAKLLRSWLSEE
ncbi:MAG TPA: flagellar basal-body MS-ring/collar protein FliF [Bacillales bacterium]|nr:flagellar basal-body MS-ring/collar protein FliF [Bacillales bacterium]